MKKLEKKPKEQDKILTPILNNQDRIGTQADFFEKFNSLTVRNQDKVLDYQHSLFRHNQINFWVNFTFYGIATLILVVLITLSFLEIFVIRTAGSFYQYVSAGGMFGGIIIILLLLYRNPNGELNTSLIRFSQVNLIFLGYLHRITQINEEFKHMLVNHDPSDEFNFEEVGQKFNDAIDQAVTAANEKIDDVLFGYDE
jgi:hypothetical protein